MNRNRVLVTGGCGFIGSAVIRHLVHAGSTVINVDSLTYAANPDALMAFAHEPNYQFVKADIRERESMMMVVRQYRPDAVIHLAAESHVDRSIDGPERFVETNVVGTCNLLEATTRYWRSISGQSANIFRFHHVSTDEVYGTLDLHQGAFTEDTPYAPSSPYAASKAASDHFVRAWHKTYGLPVLISNCSNNYGPWQFPEKLIPLVIVRALMGRKIPVYGRGENVRDWIHVDDHVTGMMKVLSEGVVGESYNIGACCEKRNIDVVKSICSLLDEIAPRGDGRSYHQLIEFVTDRPGHDRRYAIDPKKMRNTFDWTPDHSFESGLRQTVNWYLDNRRWWEDTMAKRYGGERLGRISEGQSQSHARHAVQE